MLHRMIEHVMRLLTVCLMALTASTARADNKHDFMWKGLFVEQLTLRDSVAFNTGEVRANPVYQLPLFRSGANEGVTLGYRWQLGESNMFVGFDGSYMPGGFAGSASIRGPKGREVAAIALTSGDTFSVGVHLGKETKPGRMMFVGMGMSQTDMTFETHGIRGLQSNDASLDGQYVTVGSGRQLAGGVVPGV